MAAFKNVNAIELFLSKEKGREMLRKLRWKKKASVVLNNKKYISNEL